ncbi:MAG: serine hydrolase [Ruminococcus sp.]|uniref:D-alanyl-D-alanine carboxypeptidase family protein n=1 Tax=Ruminococcus sp. TaxID=41978 RepID=UPI0025FB4308|nr:serine hydrolase [Ruminococcus sp.]MCR5601088.1 serine hydrolase [Ruminococcus sp.]
MKKIIKSFAIAAAGVFLTFSLISADESCEKAPAAYVLMEAETHSVLEGKNEDMRLNAGYLSKLMGLLLIADDIDSGEYGLTDIVTASDNVKNTKGSVVWLESGDEMSVEELLKSVIIGNANDAMTVLAERSSGSVEQFVMDMNAKAFDLGLRDTVFVSPYGYYNEKEYTTAHDTAIICSELAEHECLLPYFSTWRDFVKNGRTELVSENTLTRTYERHIGFKACHSAESGFCIAEGARNEKGTTFIAIALGAENESVSFGCAKKLLKSGFRGYKVLPTVFLEEMMKPLDIRNGVASSVELTLASQGAAAVPKAAGELRARVVIPDYISAPVKERQKVGTAAFYNEDTLVYETDIITKTAVDRLDWCYVFKNTLYKMIRNKS